MLWRSALKQQQSHARRGSCAISDSRIQISSWNMTGRRTAVSRPERPTRGVVMPCAQMDMRCSRSPTRNCRTPQSSKPLSCQLQEGQGRGRRTFPSAICLATDLCARRSRDTMPGVSRFRFRSPVYRKLVGRPLLRRVVRFPCSVGVTRWPGLRWVRDRKVTIIANNSTYIALGFLIFSSNIEVRSLCAAVSWEDTGVT